MVFLTEHQFRILVPSASVPPSSGTSGMWRRKSSSGAVDAQGNLLIHPMVSSIFLYFKRFLIVSDLD
jgi:glycerol-3-phosphate O-acyltransferase/dihydroxyacetone phosphate acyltransferase